MQFIDIKLHISFKIYQMRNDESSTVVMLVINLYYYLGNTIETSFSICSKKD